MSKHHDKDCKKHKHHKNHDKNKNNGSRNFLGSEEILAILLLFVLIAFIFPRFFADDEQAII